MMLNLSGDINDIHLWNNKYNLPKECVKVSVIYICSNWVNFLPENTFFLIFGGATARPPTPPARVPMAAIDLI